VTLCPAAVDSIGVAAGQIPCDRATVSSVELRCIQPTFLIVIDRLVFLVFIHVQKKIRVNLLVQSLIDLV